MNFRWRAERRESDLKKEVSAKREMLANLASRKQWTLDEEGDDDEEQPDVKVEKEDDAKEEEEDPAEVKMEVEEEDEEDPLDAFMRGVQDEVRKIGGKFLQALRECRF